MASNVEIRVFLSSTCYELKDLRAELAEFLADVGIRAILSDDEAFPDTPGLFPYEQCLSSLEECDIVISIIDGQYGQAFEWPNSGKEFETLKGRKISPTHGEFVCAMARKKRMFVFVRDQIWTGYGYYRAMQKPPAGGGVPSEPVLPKYVEKGTFEFLEEVKRLCPAPWIEQFKTVVDLKRRVLFRLMNELAALLHAQGGRITALVDIFENVFPTIPANVRDQVLSRIAKVTGHDEQIKNLQGQNQTDKTALELVRKKAADLGEEVKRLAQAGSTASTQIDRLNEQLEEARKEALQLEKKVAESEANMISRTFASVPVASGSAGYSGLSGMLTFPTSSESCSGCGSPLNSLYPYPTTVLGLHRSCSQCHKKYCSTCAAVQLGGITQVCQSCRNSLFRF